MTYVSFKLDTDADGIALITWDAPGRSMNVIDLNVIEELSDIVETVAGDRAIRGAVIASGKEAFCAGADLTMLETSIHTFAEMARARGEEAAAAALFEHSRKLSLLYRRLETCGKPWVAAITGTALGGGFDLAVKDFRKAIELDAKDSEAWLWLGLALRKENQNAEAHKALAKSLELNPNRLWTKQQLDKTPAQ